MKERNRYHIADGQILLFDKCDEVFHIEQFFGKEQQYRYIFKNSFAAESNSKYQKNLKVSANGQFFKDMKPWESEIIK